MTDHVLLSSPRPTSGCGLLPVAPADVRWDDDGNLLDVCEQPTAVIAWSVHGGFRGGVVSLCADHWEHVNTCPECAPLLHRLAHLEPEVRPVVPEVSRADE